MPTYLSSKILTISTRASSQFETLLGRYLTPSEAKKIFSSTWIWGSGQKSSGWYSTGPIRNGDSRHESATLTSPGCKYTNSCAFCSGKCFLFWERLFLPTPGSCTLRNLILLLFLFTSSCIHPTFLGTSINATSHHHFGKVNLFLWVDRLLVWIFKSWNECVVVVLKIFYFLIWVGAVAAQGSHTCLWWRQQHP